LIIVPLLVFLLSAAVTLFTVVVTVSTIEGASMFPTLHDGDRILVTRGYDAPARGDIVSFRALERDGSTIRVIKRVVALPGDSIEIIGDVAYVNGAASAVAPNAIVGTDVRLLGAMTVPDGTLFVLGDNRPDSLDSRFTGPIGMDTIIGRGVTIIWPLGRVGEID